MADQELAVLASKYAEITDRIHQLQEQADSLKALIMEGREPGEYEAGALTVKIRRGKRTLDAAAFEKHFPVQRFADCYQIKPKSLSAIVQQVGEPALHDCVKVGASSLVIE